MESKSPPPGETPPIGGKRGAFPAPVRAVGLFSSGRSPVVWFSLLCCHKLNLTPPLSTHSPPALAGEGGGASHQRGRCRRQHTYSPLNQPALWAEPEPPRAPARCRLEPGRRKAPEPSYVREYIFPALPPERQRTQPFYTTCREAAPPLHPGIPSTAAMPLLPSLPLSGSLPRSGGTISLRFPRLLW